jgi:hypothetical protein
VLGVPWWQDLVTGVPKPIIDKGYVAVPEESGLGLEQSTPGGRAPAPARVLRFRRRTLAS